MLAAQFVQNDHAVGIAGHARGVERVIILAAVQDAVVSASAGEGARGRLGSRAAPDQAGRQRRKNPG